MKQYACLILACAMLVVGPGCRRGGGSAGKPRPPIKLDSEADILFPQVSDETDLARSMKSKAKIRIAARGDGGEISFPKEVLELGAQIEWGQATNDAEKLWLKMAQVELQRQLYELDQKRKQENLNKMGEAYLVFVGKYPVDSRSFEYFRMHLRRERLTPLRRLLDEGQLVAVFPADPKVAGQILVYQAVADNGRHPCFQSNSVVASLTPAELGAKLANQK